MENFELITAEKVDRAEYKPGISGRVLSILSWFAAQVSLVVAMDAAALPPKNVQDELARSGTVAASIVPNVQWIEDGERYTNKIAVILNGDSKEDRHINNTERAIRVLKKQGFTKFWVAQDHEVEIEANIKQFAGTKAGLDEMFAELTGSVEKDALVFVYGTGHGKNVEGGALKFDQPIGVQEVKDYLRAIKGKRAKMVSVFDNCYSGVMPKALIEDEEHEGKVFSPGVECSVTQCQAYIPEFFEGLERGRDLDGDGTTTMEEAHFVAMQHYRTDTRKIDAHGEYMQSKIELSSENFDEIVGGDTPVLIEIGATHCGPCKPYYRELCKAKGILGHGLEVVTLTKDTNPEVEMLLEKLGVDKVTGLPVTVSALRGETEVAFAKLASLKEILSYLKKRFGLEVDETLFNNLKNERVRKKTGQDPADVAKFNEKFGHNFNFMIHRFRDGEFDWLLGQNLEQEDVKGIFEKAIARILLSRAPTDLLSESSYNAYRDILGEEAAEKIYKEVAMKAIKAGKGKQLANGASFWTTLPFSEGVFAIIMENASLIKKLHIDRLSFYFLRYEKSFQYELREKGALVLASRVWSFGMKNYVYFAHEGFAEEMLELSVSLAEKRANSVFNDLSYLMFHARSSPHHQEHIDRLVRSAIAKGKTNNLIGLHLSSIEIPYWNDVKKHLLSFGANILRSFHYTTPNSRYAADEATFQKAIKRTSPLGIIYNYNHFSVHDDAEDIMRKAISELNWDEFVEKRGNSVYDVVFARAVEFLLNDDPEKVIMLYEYYEDNELVEEIYSLAAGELD